MEEIAEGFLRAIGGVIRWFLWNIIFHVVLFNIGRIALLLVTLGKYPRYAAAEKDVEKISLVGVAVVVHIWVAIALYNNYG